MNATIQHYINEMRKIPCLSKLEMGVDKGNCVTFIGKRYSIYIGNDGYLFTIYDDTNRDILATAYGNSLENWGDYFLVSSVSADEEYSFTKCRLYNKLFE